MLFLPELQSINSIGCRWFWTPLRDSYMDLANTTTYSTCCATIFTGCRCHNEWSSSCVCWHSSRSTDWHHDTSPTCADLSPDRDGLRPVAISWCQHTSPTSVNGRLQWPHPKSGTSFQPASETVRQWAPLKPDWRLICSRHKLLIVHFILY